MPPYFPPLFKGGTLYHWGAVTRKMNKTFLVENLTYFNFTYDYFVCSYLISEDKRKKQIFREINPLLGGYTPLGFGGTVSMLSRVASLTFVPKITCIVLRFVYCFQLEHNLL